MPSTAETAFALELMEFLMPLESPPNDALKKPNRRRVVLYLMVGAVVLAAAAWGLWRWHAGSVPSLIRQLAHQDPAARENAAIALGKWGPKAQTAVPALVAALADDQADVRAKAAQALESINEKWFDLPATKDVVVTLMERSENEDHEVRLAAVQTLGKIGWNAQDAVPALIERIKDREKPVYFAAWTALIRFDLPPNTLVPVLIEIIELDRHPDIRAYAMYKLWEFGPVGDAAVPALVRSLADKDGGIRSIAAMTLARMGPFARIARPALVKTLADRDDRVRERALKAIVEIGSVPADALPELIGAMKDPNREIRKLALEALGRIGREAKSAVPALIECLKDKEDDAISALGRIGPDAREAVPALIECLKDRRSAVAAWALGRIGPAAKDAVPALIGFLKRRCDEVDYADDGVLHDVTEALGKIGGSAGVPALIECLKSDKRHVRVTAADALGRLREAAVEALAELIRCTADENLEVRSMARYALERIEGIARIGGPPGAGPSVAVPPLTKLLKDKKDAFRCRAADALSKLGPAARDAVPDLIDCLKDPSADVRAAAAHALGQVGPDAREAVPALIGRLPDPAVRVRALLALGHMGPAAKKAVPAIVQWSSAVDDPHRIHVNWALEQIGAADLEDMPALIGHLKGDGGAMAAAELAKFGPAAKDAVPALIDCLQSGGKRSEAAKALGKIGPAAKQAVLALVQWSSAGDEDHRKHVKSALEQIGVADVKDMPALIEYLKGDCAPMAAVALAQFGPPAKDAVPALIECLKNPANRNEGARALGNIGPAAKDAVPALIECLKSRATSIETARALGKIGSGAKDVVPALIECMNNSLSDGDFHVRASVATALGEFGPAAKDALPVLQSMIDGHFGYEDHLWLAVRKIKGP